MLRSATLLVLLPAALAVPLVERLDRRAPLPEASSSSGVPSSYIVKLRGDTTEAALSSAFANHRPDYIYRGRGFRGFRLETPFHRLPRIPFQVEYVEQDAVLTITDSTVSRPSAPWGLARISSRTLGAITYRYDATSGKGTCSCIIDTGVDLAHPDLSGHAVWGANLADPFDADGNGHGTSVASVVGGLIYGVAKKTAIIAVKVLDSNGSAALVSSGVFVTAAAGGSGDDANNYSPTSKPTVFAVGASDRDDNRAPFSNYGLLIDMFAPGVDILPGSAAATIATKDILKAILPEIS
ncbi:subtilisin-like serine protease PR1B [Lasiosphaeria hispida]|uniref:Subtilisin-like serine protease PR1B n=1 Tax=Lasiosphaeria hispida TaxID=260671 RepID=A0AAJ0MBB0_9PEZI|nr:subtilisin-like serine protease PR1B [Lasiosphaeria hispida]